MRSNYKRLGKYIRQVDERNTEGKEENLLGVSVQKNFIPSIANTVGTDFTKYKVVKKGQFTYIPDTSRRGDKIGIALLEEYEEGLVSNVYTVFEITDEEHLLPQYLMLWFQRPEFDRYARFKSHGSVREIFDWNELCMVELPVPDIEKQKNIVRAYRAINDRIELKKKINDNLAASADAIFSNFFGENRSANTVYFTDIVQLLGGGTPKTDDESFWNGSISFFTPKDITDSPFCLITEKKLTESGLKNCSSRLYPMFTTFVTCRGTVGNLAMAGVPMAMNQSCYAIQGKNGYPPFFVYAFTKRVIAAMKKKASGAVFSALVTRDFNIEKVTEPTIADATMYQKRVAPIFNQILSNTKEIQSLYELQRTLLLQLSSG